jgi:quercetin dioxygenase-like cupin family protein
MKITGVPFTTTDWSTITPTEHAGETGKAFWRTVQAGDIRVRMVEYTPGYKADHWCSKGHIILVLEGELLTTLQNGSEVLLTAGMSYQVQDDGEAHSSETKTGAKLFIVD